MPGAKSHGNVRCLDPCLHRRLLMMALLLLDVFQKRCVQPWALVCAGGVCFSPTNAFRAESLCISSLKQQDPPWITQQ